MELSDVLIGEVWLCSGQSNMEMPMTGYHNQPVWNGNDDLAGAGNSQLRLFHIPHAVSVDPQTEGKGSWAHAGPGSAAGFSAVGFRFAQRLQAILKVPVGMIQATWGGTPIEAWMDGESLRQFKQTEIPVPVAGEKADRLKPTCLYNGMIHPVGGYGIKGFLWYQGEANVGRPAAYRELMQGMIQGWRKQWKNDDLFFYFVQIAPWNYGKRKDSTPYLREAQAMVAREVPETGMVVSIDKGSATTVHPPDKKAISDRLLYWALGNAYGREGISYRSPEYEKMEIRKDSVILNFREAPQGLYATGDQIAGFEMAGEDQKFYPARARVFKRTVIVLSAQVKKPVAVRYAFTDMVTGNLYSGAGIPVAPFRTDNW
ncbi:sialate O-acetylesterase [Niabella terrae]